MLCQCSFMHDTEFIIYSNIFLSNIHIACWVRFFSAQLFSKSMFYERIGRGSHDQKEWLQHKILDQRPFLWKHMPTLNFFDASSFHNFTRESNILWGYGYKQIGMLTTRTRTDLCNCLWYLLHLQKIFWASICQKCIRAFLKLTISKVHISIRCVKFSRPIQLYIGNNFTIWFLISLIKCYLIWTSSYI